MTENIYEEAKPITRPEAERAFSSGVSETVSDALVRVTFNDTDWRWIQEKCLFFIGNSDSEVRGTAITCLGHLARIHGKLDLRRVMPLLISIRHDAEVGGRVEDTIDDIETFV